MNTENYSFRLRDSFLGIQFMFVAFGALVLVPLLTGLDPSVALLSAGAGTILFQLVTKFQVPIFLASSFAFIAPIIYGVETWGIPGTMCGLMAAGVVYVCISFFIKGFGVNAIKRIFPTIVTGPVIMVIGLILAPVAVNMAMGKTGNGSAVLFSKGPAMVIAFSAFFTTVLVSILAKGWLKLIPILCGVIVGYFVSFFFGFFDWSPIAKAPWFAVPNFTYPEWNPEAVIFMIPVALAPAIEHFGDIIAIKNVTGVDYLKKPGVHRTMMGDGLATALAAVFGGPPNTTYSEVTGAVALTRVYNPFIMTWAAFTAIALAFIGKLGAFLQTIPAPVMGGIMLLLFGAIIVVGLNSLVKAQIDLLDARNLTIVASILIFGIGGMVFSFEKFTLGGIGLAGVTGVILNLILPGKKNIAEDVDADFEIITPEGMISESDIRS